MARPLRIEYPGAWYHVMNRGRRGEEIFSDKKDYEAFVVLLRETGEMFDFQVSAYCLMSNHYHLLVRTPSGVLSRVMKHINGVDTQRYNRYHKVDGQLFKGRYKSILVEEDSYLLELLRYIHGNPVRVGICKAVEEYAWTSHHGYVSRVRQWDWLYKQFLLGMFAGKTGKAGKNYIEFIHEGDSLEVTEFYSKKNLASVFGSADFVVWIKEKFYLQKQHEEVPGSRQLAPTILAINKAVCQLYKINKKDLIHSIRGQKNEPRNLAIYLARRHSGLSLAEIGSEFGLRKYSSVSSIVMRTEHLMSQSKQLQEKAEKVRAKLHKSSR